MGTIPRVCNQFQRVNVKLIAEIKMAGLSSQPRRPTGLPRSRKHTLMSNSILPKLQVDGEVVAKGMRRAQGLDGARLFMISCDVAEFLAHSRSPPTSPALLLRFRNNCRMISMFRPAKRKSTSLWQGISAYKPSLFSTQ